MTNKTSIIDICKNVGCVILATIFGVLALATLSQSLLASLCFVLACLLFIPAIRRRLFIRIPKFKKNSSVLTVILTLTGFTIFGFQAQTGVDGKEENVKQHVYNTEEKKLPSPPVEKKKEVVQTEVEVVPKVEVSSKAIIEETVPEEVISNRVAEEESKPDKETERRIKELESEIEKLPSKTVHAHLMRYEELLKLDPDNQDYTEQVAFYKGKRSALMKVIKITDGDTIVVLSPENKQIKIRLEGIDAPESGQEYGSKSKSFVGDLLKKGGGKVRVEVTGVDRYQRSLARLYLEDYTNVNEAVVSNGYAWHFKKYSKDQDLADAEIKAREKKVGLWASISKPMSPWEYRDRQKIAAQIKLEKQKAELQKKNTAQKPKATTQKYWLNTSSNVRHNSGCRWYFKTKRGRACGSHEGKACGICGG